MANVSPTMKHAPVRKSKEQAALEEFMNTIPPALAKEGDVLVDNSVTEWVEIPETSLDPVVDSMDVVEQLDDLAGDVDGVTTAVAMESYRRIFHGLTKLTGHPIQEGVSLESFKATKGGKTKLAKAIREHADMIRGCVYASLEEYIGEANDSMTQIVSDYKQALSKLDGVKNSVDVPDHKVKIDHKRIWDMWFVDNHFMQPKDITEQISAFEDLASVISKATDHAVSFMGKEEGDKQVDRAGQVIDKVLGKDSSRATAIPNHKDIELMFNTTVSFSDGRAKFTRKPTRKPSGDWTMGDFGWIALWGILGGPLGAVAAAGYRGIVGGSGSPDHSRKDSTREMHQFIDGVKKLSAVVTKIQDDVNQLNKAVTAGGNAQRQAVFKRSAAPILELATKTVGLITEITYGAATLFQKIADA